MYRKSSFSTNK